MVLFCVFDTIVVVMINEHINIQSKVMPFNCKYHKELYADPITVTIDMYCIPDYRLDASDPITVEIELIWSIVTCFCIIVTENDALNNMSYRINNNPIELITVEHKALIIVSTAVIFLV